MQKFTRALTREIEVGGERLAVTLSEEGLSFRVVGSRKPPHDMTWAACLVACTQGREQPPGPSEMDTALKALRAGGKERPEKEQPAHPEGAGGGQQPAGHAPPPPPPPESHPPVREQTSAERTTREKKAKTATSVERLPALLARLDAWLTEHRPRFAKTLLPGATPDQLAALADDLGHALPDELRVWLAWHNGQRGDVPGAFVQSWHLLGTRRIAQLKRELDAEQSANWNSAWIPFLDDDNDNYVCVDTRQPGFPVRECWRGKQEHAVVADSLTAWVEQFVTDLERGEYVEDSERGEFYKKG